MAAARVRWGVRRLAVCFKTRDPVGLQRRWSGMLDQPAVPISYSVHFLSPHILTRCLFISVIAPLHRSFSSSLFPAYIAHPLAPSFRLIPLVVARVSCVTLAAIATSSGVHSSERTPVFHVPRDECGGGSAWAAGILDA